MTNSLLLTKKAITAGLCIRFYTPTGFIDELRSGELVHVPLSEEELAGTEWGLFVHRSRATSPAIRAVTRVLSEGFEALRSDIGTLVAGTERLKSKSPAASEESAHKG
jgi:DNA-binding transcriptional LysR family regulator